MTDFTTNKYGDIISVDNGESVDTVEMYSINGVTDSRRYHAARKVAQGLNTVEDSRNLSDHIEQLKEYLAEYSDVFEEYGIPENITSFENAIAALEAQAESILDDSATVFDSEPAKVKLTAKQAQYLRDDQRARNVTSVNISTGIHEGNLPVEENAERVEQSLEDIISSINSIRHAIYNALPEEYIMEMYQEAMRDDFEDNYDYDDYDDYDDYNNDHDGYDVNFVVFYEDRDHFDDVD